MKIDISGKSALVTGSTAGIGHAIAKGLASSGADVWINGRNQDKVDDAVHKLEGLGGKVQGIAADDTIPEGEGFERGVRRLQREGRTVCVVVTGASAGMAAADCAIGLMREGEVTPWGAHLICKDDLSDVRFLIHSCVVARQVSKQSVNIALGAATLGAE